MYGAEYVEYVNDDGNVNYNRYNYTNGVRPVLNRKARGGRHVRRSESPDIKRIGNTSFQKEDKYKGIPMKDFDKVTDFGNLYSAYRSARRGKGHYSSKERFAAHAMRKLTTLQYRLKNKTYDVGAYNKFKIYEPKERIIESGTFVDNIVQHSLCDNALLPVLEKEFIPTNYAGQYGKGTLYGLDSLRDHEIAAFSEYGYDCWILKADIRKYFYSIEHDKLKEILREKIRDPELMWLCEKFIDSTPSPGLPLGNQISQVFALLYLSDLDHFITEILDIQYYGRYMDDFYLIHQNKSHLEFCLFLIEDYLEELGLTLNGKTQLIPFKNGIKFCGFHTYITPDGKVIRKLVNSKKRAAQKKYRRMAKLVKAGKLEPDKFKQSYLSWKSHISHGNCVKLAYQTDQMIREILEEGCDMLI